MRAPRIGPTSAVFGFLALVPAVVFLTAVALKYGLGLPAMFDSLETLFLHPVGEAVTVLSPVVAFALSALAVLRVRFVVQGRALTSTLRIELSVPHLVVLAASAAIFAVFAPYFVVENF